jgi:4-hydroxy-tetrahydrodipicolinate synthase
MERARRLSAYVVSVTPFTKDGALDEDGLRRHLQRLAAARAGVYLVGSGSGEAFSLGQAEMRRTLEIAKEEIHGTVPVRAMGPEPKTAAQMIEFAAMVEDVGLDATQVSSLDLGHGYVPSERQIAAYLSDVLHAVRSPVVLSSHYLTGYSLPVGLIRTIVEEHDNVIGLNVATRDARYLMRVVEVVGDTVEVHGTLDLILTSFALGADGVSAGESNIAPHLGVSLVEHYAAGRVREAEEAYRALMSLAPIARDYGGVSGIKAALRLLELPGGYPRAPRLDVSAEQLAEIDELIERLDLRRMVGAPTGA